MTTGCNCPRCGGLAPPGRECERCEIAAMPPGPEKAIRRIVNRLLNGTEPEKEAG
jgi:hypothetical protein